MIKIDKGVTMPTRILGARPVIYPFSDMEVVDSFFMPLGEKNLGARADYWAKKLGHKYTTRKAVENGMTGARVWRVS